MKRFFIGVLVGALIFGGITAVSAYTILANNIGYTPSDSSWKKTNGEDITNVKDAIDDLYTKANGNKSMVCLYISGTKGEVGSKYICDPGDGIARYFYILKNDTNNVKLIMEKNLSDEVGTLRLMGYNSAMNFLEDNHINTLWKNVINVDLPDAQEIADAGGISNFDVKTSTSRELYFGGNINASSNYSWLFNYLRGCGVYGKCSSGYPDADGYPWGYFTKNLKVNDDTNSWIVNTNGFLDIRQVNDEARGVRPVITVLKSQLSN